MATGVNGSEDKISFPCCICAKKTISREAEIYCVECQDYFCLSCTDLHKMFPSAVGVHQFLDKSNFSPGSEHSMLPSCPTERCTVHNTKLIDMYCEDHDKVVCATCIALNHRTCQNIHSVPDEMDSLYEKKSAYEDIKSQLLEKKDNIEDLMKTKEHLVTELDKYKEKAAEAIRHFRKEMEALLDTLKSESIKKLEEMHTKMRKKLKGDIKVAQEYIDELTLSMEKVSKTFGNKAQEFVSIKMAEKSLFEIKKSEKDLAKALDVSLLFIADTEIKDFLNESKTLGMVSRGLKTTLYKVKSKKEVNLRQTTDSMCNFRDSCFTEDGLLLLSDSHNNSLKRVDLSSESVIDQLVLGATPLAVCQTGKDEIAVNLEDQSIQFVSLGNKMAVTKHLKLDHICWGLTYKNDKLFISDGSTSLYIHDMNGSMLSKITTDKQGNAIFKVNRHICLSSYGDRIYIADTYKGLVSVDLQGNYESTYSDPDTIPLEAVCTDGRGNVLSSCWGPSKIVQLNEKPKKNCGTVGEVKDSQSVCFDQEQQQLVVTMYNRDTIDIYELE